MHRFNIDAENLGGVMLNLDQEISHKQTLSVFQTQSLNILVMNKSELFIAIQTMKIRPSI